ncbi:MAG: PEGA domain-containing protein [Lachnospiraceae bacterium]|nr:PEGA domain-containing protein [Lachnospiraceae bacterium]
MKRRAALFIFLSFILTLFLFPGCSLSLPGKEGGDDGNMSGAAEETENTDQDLLSEKDLQGTVTGVLLSVDEAEGTIRFANTAGGKRYELKLDSSTDYYNSFGDVMVGDQFEIGDIAEITASLHSGLVKTVRLVDSFFYSGVKNYEYSLNKGVFTADGVNYRIGSQTVVIEDGETADFEDIMPGDALSIRGVDRDLYSIIIDHGTGYVRMTGGEYFRGGVVQIGKNIREIENDMLVGVGEGNYDLIVIYNNDRAKKPITVRRGEETFVDLSEFKGTLIKYGKITFTFDPPDALPTVKIDGKQVELLRPVELEYGAHTLVITADGYKSLHQKIRIAEPMANLDVTLEKDVSANSASSSSSGTSTDSASGSTKLPPDTFKKKDTSSENTDSASDSSSSPAAGTDSSSAVGSGSSSTLTPTGDGTVNQLYIDSPEGCEVYFDGMYKGLAPLHFTKTGGTHVITLRKDGYRSKTYTLSLSEADNETYSFNALEELGED